MKQKKLPIAQSIIIVTLFLLQFLVVPAISVNGICPNLIMVYIIFFAIYKPGNSSIVLAFFASLVYSVVFGGPIGMFSLVVVIVVFVVNKIVTAMGEKPLLFYLFLAIFSVLAEELFYGILLLIFGFQTDFFACVFLIALPSFVYDLIALLILMPIVRIFIKPKQIEEQPQPVDIV